MAVSADVGIPIIGIAGTLCASSVKIGAVGDRHAVPVNVGQNYVTPPHFTVSFNGSSSYVDFGNSGTLDSFIIGRAFTIDCWIKLGSLGYLASGVMMSKVKDEEIYCLLFDVINYGDHHRLRGSLSTVSGFDDPVSTAVLPNAADEWHHLLMAYDDLGDRKCYLAIDGQWVDSYETQGATVGDLREEEGANIGLGRQMFGGSWFKGEMAWIRISNHIRYPVGVDFISPSRCTSPLLDANTLEIWTLDGGAGDTAVASVSSLNNGAMTDCTWQECE